MLKRILSLLVTLALIAGTVMVPVMAEGEETTPALDWSNLYEGEEIFNQNFDGENVTVENCGLSVSFGHAAIENGKLKLTYDAEVMKKTNGDATPSTVNKGDLKWSTGKYAVEVKVSMYNKGSYPSRKIANLRGASNIIQAFTTGNNNNTRSASIYAGPASTANKYEDIVNNKEYLFKTIFDMDANKCYTMIDDTVFHENGIDFDDIDSTYMILFQQNVDKVNDNSNLAEDADKGGDFAMTNTLDDIRIYRVYTEDELPAFTLASSSIENGATEVSVGAGSVDLTFSNKVASETIANATISGATGVTPVLSEDGKTLTLSWSELEFGATCVIDLSGVKDTYQQSLTGEAISFSTESKPPVFIEVDEIYSQDFSNTTVEDCGLSIDLANATIKDGKLLLTYDNGVMNDAQGNPSTSLVNYSGINWTEGKYAVEYKISMTNPTSSPRRVFANLRTGGSNLIQGAYTGNNGNTSGKKWWIEKTLDNVVDGQEYALKFIFDMDNNVCYSYLDGNLISKEGRTFSDKTGTLIFLVQQNIDGYKVNDEYVYGDFKMTNTIDDIRIYEVYKEGEIPAFNLVSSTIEDTEISNKAGSVSLTFSNKLDNTTIANAVITGGIENPVVTPSLDATGKVLTLAWEDDLELDTIYTVDFSGVTDKAGQSVSNGTLTFATKTDYVRNGDYIIAQDFNNTTVEDCGLTITKSNASITEDGKLHLTYSPSMSGAGAVQASLPERWYPKTVDAETGIITGGGKYVVEMKLAMNYDGITYPAKALVNLRGSAKKTADSTETQSSVITLGNVGTSKLTSEMFYPSGWNTYENVVNDKEYSLKYIIDMDNMKYQVYVNEEKFVSNSVDEWDINANTIYISSMYLINQNPDTYTDKNAGTTTTGAYAMTNTIDDIYVYPVELVEHNAPVIVSSTPAANTTNVSEETTVEITFDEQIDIASVNDSTLYVTGSDVKILEKTLSEDKKTLTVSFDGDLAFETEQIVTLNGIKSVYGKAMEETTFTFTTREGYLKVTDNEFSINGTKADVLTKGTLKAVRKVSNYSDKDYTATLILALYKGKALADILTFENQTIKSGNKGELSGTITIPELTGTETYTVKAMLWDSINGMIPLENPAIISNK